MTKRVLAFLMVIAMVFSLLPTVVVAEEVAATPGYKMILQKAHNQTSALDVDVYLQANTADQGDVTTVQFDVASETLSLAGAVDAEGNSLIGSDARIVYAPTEAAIPVSDAGMTLVATISLDGENAETTNWADLVTVNNIEVVANELAYTDGGEGVSTEPAGAVTVEKIPFTACEAHGTTGWTAGLPATSGVLAAGSYYLTEDVTLTGILDVAENAEVTVCLNGHNITAADTKRIFELNNAGATLNICDCTATGEGKDYTAGMLIPKHNQGGALRTTAAENVEINFYGGIIDGTNSSKKEASVALVVGGALNMLGGKVQNFDAGLVSSGRNYGPIIVRGKRDGADGVATIANVTFVNCGSSIMSGAPGGSDRSNGAVLTVENVTVLDSAAGAWALDIGESRFKSVTLKGDCKFDAPVFVADNEVLTLALGANADVNIVTTEEMTEEQFNERVKMAEGCETLGSVVYENKGVYVTYENGKFVFAEGHTIKDKHAAGIVFKVWDKTDSLPKEGNWYLENDVTVTSAVAVEGPLNLDLNGHTVTSNGTSRFYNVYVGVLSLFDGTSTFDDEGNWTAAGTGKLTGFNQKDAGSITVNTGGVLNLYSANISGNSGNNGPAIYMCAVSDGRNQNGAIFNMYGGEISGNTSTYYGSAVSVNNASELPLPEGKNRAEINIYGGKISGNSGNVGTFRVINDTDVTVTGGEFSGNSVTGSGGVFYMTGDSSLDISGGKFTNNSATSNGGVIYTSDTTVLDITGGEFVGNNTVLYATNGGTIDISNAKIQGCTGQAIRLVPATNKILTANLTNCELTGNSSGALGSVIRVSARATLKLDDTVITGNSNTSGGTWACGTVYVESASSKIILSGKTVIAGNTTASSTMPLLADLVFQHNSVRTMWVDGLEEGAHINAYNFKNTNQTAAEVVQYEAGKAPATWNCGWINYYQSTATSGNTYKDAAAQNISYMDTDGDGTKEFTFGHWHEVNGEMVEYTATTSLPKTAGNYYLSADVTTGTSSWNPVSGTTLCFNGHVVTAKSGNFCFVRADATLTFQDCTGTYAPDGTYIGGGATNTNTGKASGRGISVTNAGSTINWEGGKLFGITTYNDGTGESAGNVIYMNKASTINFSGGAVCNNTTTDASAEVAAQSKRAVIQANAGTLNITGGSFYGNECTTLTTGTAQAGVIRLAGATLTIKNAKFFDNYCNGSAGVLYADSGSHTIENCEFKNNTGTAYGAIYTTRALTIKDSVFEGNKAENGAGGAIYSSGNVTLSGTTFKNNEASGNGGAMYANPSSSSTATLTATNVKFTGNTAGGNGGALDFEFGKTATIKGCEFTGNTAGGQGGAIITRGKDMTMTIDKNAEGVGCTFTGNSAAKGGAISFDTYNRFTNTRTINGATFTGNTATGSGGAIFTSCGSHATNTGVLTMNVTGSTFTGNKGSDGSALSLNSYTVANMDSCTITGNESTASYYGAIFIQTASTGLTLKGKMNITGNTNADKTNNTANLYMRDGSNNPMVTITDLDPASTIGVNATVTRYEEQPVIGTAALVAGSDADIEKCIVSDNNDRFRTYVDGEGNLMLTNYVAANGTTYQTLTEALTAMADAGATEFQVQAGSSDEIELPAGITKLDLNGASVAKIKVAEGVKLDLIDSATNDYDISDGVYGKTTVDGEVNPHYYDEGTRRHYVVLTDADGVSTAHRVYVSITSKVLRPASYGAGFKAIFAADEMITETATYGIRFTGYAPDAAERDSADGWYDAHFTGMLPGKQDGAPNQKIVAFKNAISKEDTHRWTNELYGVPYVTIGDVEVKGVEQSLIMQDLATKALANLSADNEVYQLIEAMMTDCGVSAI